MDAEGKDEIPNTAIRAHLAPSPEAEWKMEFWDGRFKELRILFCFALIFKTMTAIVDKGYEPLSGKKIILGRDGRWRQGCWLLITDCITAPWSPVLLSSKVDLSSRNTHKLFSE